MNEQLGVDYLNRTVELIALLREQCDSFAAVEAYLREAGRPLTDDESERLQIAWETL